MRIQHCYVCSSPVYPGHGIMFVRNDSKEFRFCRSKCHRGFKLKRNPRKLKWTKAYRRAHGKEMAVDPTFDFEKQRNRPVKYDRDLVGKTVNAMKRVEEIRMAREERFYAQRMKDANTLDNIKMQGRRDIVQNIELVAPAAGTNREAINVAEKSQVKLVKMQAARHAANKVKAAFEKAKMTEA